MLTHNAVGVQRGGDAFEAVAAAILAVKHALHQTMGRGADQHRVGFRQRLQARRDIGRLTDGQLLGPPLNPDLADHDPAGMDTDSDPKRKRQVGKGELWQSLYNTQPGPHRPQGLVFVRPRIAKIDQQAIPQILGDIAVKTADDPGAQFLVGADDFAQILGIELLR